MKLIREHIDYVTPVYAVGFMSADMASIVHWDGTVMGKAEIITSWRIPSGSLYQVESVIDNRRYTGRTLGANKLWRGKAKRNN